MFPSRSRTWTRQSYPEAREEASDVDWPRDGRSVTPSLSVELDTGLDVGHDILYTTTKHTALYLECLSSSLLQFNVRQRIRMLLACTDDGRQPGTFDWRVTWSWLEEATWLLLTVKVHLLPKPRVTAYVLKNIRFKSQNLLGTTRHDGITTPRTVSTDYMHIYIYI